MCNSRIYTKRKQKKLGLHERGAEAQHTLLTKIRKIVSLTRTL